MKRKIHKIIVGNSSGYAFWCNGCNTAHVVTEKWSVDEKTMTISPSILVHENWKMPDNWDYATAPKDESGNLLKQENGKLFDAIKTPRCHSFVRNGKIQYLGDCTHLMANKTVEIPEFEMYEDGTFDRPEKTL